MVRRERFWNNYWRNVICIAVFQYSSSESLNEVTRENFDSCNTAAVLKAYSTGNTTVTLSEPGQRFFVSGNRLYCLGGMKLQVNVENNQSFSPAAAPQPNGTALPRPSSKTDDTVPGASAASIIGGREALVLAFVCYVISTLMVVFWLFFLFFSLFFYLQVIWDVYIYILFFNYTVLLIFY